MQSTAIKQAKFDTMYQNKIEEVFPKVEISAESVKDLLVKNHNQIFPLNTVVRVVGIKDRDIGGKSHTFYELEIREASVGEKTPEEMTPEEILAKIDEQSPEN